MTYEDVTPWILPEVYDISSFKERANVMVIIMVLMEVAVAPVALEALTVSKVLPNTHDSNDHDGRDIQVPIHAHGGVALSSNLDAIHDLPNYQEPIPYQDLEP